MTEYNIISETPYYTGVVVNINKLGFGIVKIENTEKTILVPKKDLNNCTVNDKVTVQLFKDSTTAGKILQVYKKEMGDNILVLVLHSYFVSTVLYYLVVDEYNNKYNILGGNITLKRGDVCLCDCLKFYKKIENIHENPLEILKYKYKDLIKFEEYKSTLTTQYIDGNDSERNDSERIDYTNLYTFTIDPDDSKDYDDAISFEFLTNNNIRLGIHIADVTRILTTEYEEYAKQKCTSIYLNPEKVFHMLPEFISTNICSLIENENRDTISVIIDYNSDAKVVNFDIVKTVIKSKKRFTYSEMDLLIKTNDDYKKMYNFILKIKQKYTNIPIDISIPTITFINNLPIFNINDASADSHTLVEVCMLEANKTVANYLHDRNINFIYRNHENNQIPIINSLGLLKSVPRAYYSPENIGHWGINLDIYCHMTSPIRRYNDIIIHKILKSVLNKHENPYSIIDLKNICNDINTRTKTIEKFEILYNKYKFLNSCVYIIDNKIDIYFDAVITLIYKHGITFEIHSTIIGNLHISELGKGKMLYMTDKGLACNNAPAYNNGLSPTDIKFKIGDYIKVYPKNIKLSFNPDNSIVWGCL